MAPPSVSSRRTPPIGPLMIDVPGLELGAEDRELIAHPLVGGVILFTRNYRDAEQLRALTEAILAVKKPRPLLAVDHEGGRVQRFRVGFSRIPAMRALGRLYEEDEAVALREARAQGALIGRELAGFGFDLCFAPVLDRDCGVSTIIGDRAFAADCDTIVDLARAFRAGLAEAGMAATGKHFPGHGAVAADSHHELPTDPRTLDELQATELAPFRALVRDGIESLMMAHVLYPRVDPTPASLSQKWIGEILRGQWRYDGAVFCDDLSMNGAAIVGDYPVRAKLALAAGCDMLPVCNNRPAAIALIDAMKAHVPDRAAGARLQRLYRKAPPR